MKKPEDNDLSARRGAAVAAKAALLQAHRAARDASEPTRLARQQERLELAAARKVRQEARDRAKHEEKTRLEAEEAKDRAASDIASRAEVESREKAMNDRITRVFEDQALLKAERDRRYAARKASKK